MNVLFALISVVLVFGAGYAFRGWVGEELRFVRAELLSLVDRLESYSVLEEAKLRSYIAAEVKRLREIF